VTPRKWKALQAAKRQASRWMARAYVASVGIGQRRCKQAWCDEACVVVKVDRKCSSEELRAQRRRPFPRWLEVVVEGQRSRVAVDVQETGGELAGTLQSIIGAPVRDGKKTIGSVSAVVRGLDEPDTAKTVLISGHVARRARRPVRIANMAGTTRDPIRTNRLDHCLVDLVPLPGQCALLDGTLVSVVCDVSTLVVGQTLYFYKMATGVRTPLVFREPDTDAQFRDEHGDILKMRGLVATDRGTDRGDSGAMLFDDKFRAVATLLGAFGHHSYFIPCGFAFAALGIQLA
jgi:hypothetical protein